jgi:hypothetical protein
VPAERQDEWQVARRYPAPESLAKLTGDKEVVRQLVARLFST